MVWNANTEPFTGRCDLTVKCRWKLWAPIDGKTAQLDEVEQFEISLRACNMAIILPD